TGTSSVMTTGEGAPLTRCAGAHSTPPHRRGGERAAYREGQRTPGRSALLIGWSATQESRLRDRFTRIAMVLALVLLAAFVAEPYVARYLYSSGTPRTVEARGDLASAEKATIELFQRVSPSVVHVFAQPAGGRGLTEPDEEGGG